MPSKASITEKVNFYIILKISLLNIKQNYIAYFSKIVDFKFFIWSFRFYLAIFLFENVNFSIPQGALVGIIGPNGAGKSTLFDIIVGTEKADEGVMEVGETVEIAYVDQEHDKLDPSKTVFETITGGTESMMLGGKIINSRAYVSRFNFTGADQEKKIGVLKCYNIDWS